MNSYICMLKTCHLWQRQRMCSALVVWRVLGQRLRTRFGGVAEVTDIHQNCRIKPIQSCTALAGRCSSCCSWEGDHWLDLPRRLQQ